MASSVSGQDEKPDFCAVIGYPSGQDGGSGQPAEFPRESHIINPLWTKLVQSRWLDIGLDSLFFASLWASTSSPSINTQNKELGQYPAILTSHLVNNPYI